MALHSCIAGLTVAAAVVAAGCGNTPAPQTSSPARQTPTVTLSVTFDGGYAFVQQEDGTMNVDSLNSGHPMVLWLKAGSVEGQAPSKDPKVISKLDGSRLVLQTEGSKGVELPPVHEMPIPDDPTECRDDPTDPEQTNNRFYWPALNVWTEGTVTEDPKTLNAQVALQGGKLEILKAGGCFELRNPHGRTVLHRPMALGLESIRFTGRVAQPRVTLRTSSLQAGTSSQSIVILADNDKIDLAISHLDRHDTHSVEEPKLPLEVKDFQMYGNLLGLRSNKHTLWLNRLPARPYRPGNECVPVFIPIRVPKPTPCIKCSLPSPPRR